MPSRGGATNSATLDALANAVQQCSGGSSSGEAVGTIPSLPLPAQFAAFIPANAAAGEGVVDGGPGALPNAFAGRLKGAAALADSAPASASRHSMPPSPLLPATPAQPWHAVPSPPLGPVPPAGRRVMPCPPSLPVPIAYPRQQSSTPARSAYVAGAGRSLGKPAVIFGVALWAACLGLSVNYFPRVGILIVTVLLVACVARFIIRRSRLRIADPAQASRPCIHWDDSFHRPRVPCSLWSQNSRGGVGAERLPSTCSIDRRIG